MCGGGGTDTEKESARKVNSGEENSPAAPARIRTRKLLIMSPVLYQKAIPAPHGTGLLLLKGGYGIFNVCNSLTGCYAHKD